MVIVGTWVAQSVKPHVRCRDYLNMYEYTYSSNLECMNIYSYIHKCNFKYIIINNNANVNEENNK